jgi:hypothetical protein
MKMTKQIFQKKFLILFLTSIITLASFFTYLYLQKRSEELQKQAIKETFEELNDAVNLMDAIKDEMPKELLEVHQFLVEKGQRNEIKFYQIPPQIKDLIMVHGAKHQVLYVDPKVRLKPEIWVPLLYHEVAHLYWHTKHPVRTFEEFQALLFDSENYAYSVDCQAWDLVTKHYPINNEDLKSEVEQRLFKLYTQEAKVYNEMIHGNSKAKELWNKIIEEDIKTQKDYQKLLFEK